MILYGNGGEEVEVKNGVDAKEMLDGGYYSLSRLCNEPKKPRKKRKTKAVD